jgi:hypothetical protein
VGVGKRERVRVRRERECVCVCEKESARTRLEGGVKRVIKAVGAQRVKERGNLLSAGCCKHSFG